MNSPRQPPPRAWQRLVQRLASTRPVVWVTSRVLHHVDGVVVQLSGYRFSLTGLLSGLEVVMLTTHGARSGQPRTVPLLALLDGEAVILFASNWGQKHHPAWYHNLRARPQATLSIQGRARSYLAREATAEERERYWSQAVGFYAGYAAYRERTGGRVIPILVLTPED